MKSLTLSADLIEFSYNKVINFALQQNYVPAVRELVIKNETGSPWPELNINISTEPVFTPVWSQPIPALQAGESYTLKPIVHCDSKFLAELTEKLAARYLLTVADDSDIVYSHHYPVEVLAFDQWNGINLMPEMLAAFSTPNHPEIPRIIRSASALLGHWTGNPSFDEYQTKNPDRVRKQMAAIFEAIVELQLIYCSVPASFEEIGQRVRLADAIFNQRLANCLDISLLYAACLEAVGIHPLLIVTKGHAFTGAWLTDESFADAVNDDPSLITKRMAAGINDIAVLEATCMNAGQKSTFDNAVHSAEQKMRNTDDFILFIDVKRARFSSVRPLPLRVATPQGWEIIEPSRSERIIESPEDIQAEQRLVNVNHIDVSKQRLWERKLLDLTLRNSLLNIRITKSVIQFITLSTGKLEDALADGHEFQILGRPTDWDNSIRDTGLYQVVHQSDPIAELIQHELSQKRLRAYLPEQDLNYSLTSLFRSSKISLEENGANTLYIALGLLKWYETDASERPRYAPILLLPVEIIRKSAQKGYVIRSREEETIMNITLLEMLRQDFGLSIGGLETLPKDESGVDVRLVFNILRQAVMNRPRWDVEEQALLGNFSFSKFILWNDIHYNSDKLARNKVVASLISGKLEWQAEENASADAITDQQLHPQQIALPISTDSSQLQAVLSSGQGKTFVLHGPPGTGKSQTITNIIANALYAGKRVLFVAAKKAALDVVESRLEAIGIGPFCLELHSNKAKKSSILEQLKTAAEVVKRSTPSSFNDEAERLYQLRNELNSYVSALHEIYPFGYSLFDLFTAYSFIPGENHVYFPVEAFVQLTRAHLTTWLDTAEEMQVAALQIGQASGHPLTGINLQEYSVSLQQKALQLIQSLIGNLKKLDNYSAIAGDLLKVTSPQPTLEREHLLTQLVSLLLELPDVPASLVRTEAFEQTLAQLIGVAMHGLHRDILKDSILSQFRKDILVFPASATLNEWQLNAGKWFLPRWLGQRKIIKSLKAISNTGSLDNTMIPGILQNVIDYQEEQQVIDHATYLPILLSYLWNNGEVNWSQLKGSCEQLIAMNRLATSLLSTAGVSSWRQHMANEFSEGSKVYSNAHSDLLQQYLQTEKETREILASLASLLRVDFGIIDNENGDWKKSVARIATDWQLHFHELPDWFNWLTVRNKAVAQGLTPLVNSYESGQISSNEIVIQYQKGLYRSAAEYVLSRNSQLATFNGALFEEKIRKFREISTKFEILTKQELYARLASKIPSFTQEASQSSEIGLLQRTIRNNGRAMSIRKIFDAIPNLLPRLTPCMLMSPISVAQYFDANSVKFDMVIFDEASQLPTCEAVGAIARGTNVIVVGDPKQMPPTNFFSTNNIDEENIEKEDLESILDDCLALSMPSQHLLWHYRSKHESLIAFSNAKYYDNKLLTFPSTDDITSKVQHIPVDGFYDKGKTRTNLNEAKAIVNEIVRRLSDPELSQRSMGVVTFSSVQQLLVDDLLNELFRLRPDLEKIALESPEPLFIKNLENVQGDERDVILFSICYGPDALGKPTLNFGPINREGGWRRLNVAVSRARYEMMVFSTLRSDQIDLSRTSSEGVAGLKAFLAYAEKGRSALPNRNSHQVPADSSFEQVIADQIKQLGYEVHTQLGCSDYKIDLAVVDRDNSERYILGILTDGRNYYNANTSRDREIVQMDVLRALGWRIHKVWSTEWWTKPDRVLEGIKQAIHLAENEISFIPLVTPTSAVIDQPIAGMSIPTEMSKVSNVITYEVYPVEIQLTTSAEDFFLPQNAEKIKTQIYNVLETESPISRDLLSKRVLAAWGIGRLGSRINGYLERFYQSMNIRQENGGYNLFFWKSDQEPRDYRTFRVTAVEPQKRSAEDLPPEEISNGVLEVLANQISLPRIDLIRETAKLFGYARAGTNVEMAMSAGIDKAIQRGYAKADGDKIIYALSS